MDKNLYLSVSRYNALCISSLGNRLQTQSTDNKHGLRNSSGATITAEQAHLATWAFATLVLVGRQESWPIRGDFHPSGRLSPLPIHSRLGMYCWVERSIQAPFNLNSLEGRQVCKMWDNRQVRTWWRRKHESCTKGARIKSISPPSNRSSAMYLKRQNIETNGGPKTRVPRRRRMLMKLKCNEPYYLLQRIPFSLPPAPFSSPCTQCTIRTWHRELETHGWDSEFWH